MKRTLIALSACALILAACSGDGGTSVASLEELDADLGIETEDVPFDGIDEDAVLAFAQCMRDNGIEDFEDPDIGADGSVGFRFGGAQRNSEAERAEIRAAFEACQEHLVGLAFGPGSIDRSEIEDTLYEFAVCIRDNGYDMPDPDFSNFLGGQGGGGGGGGGPFGEDFDPQDPEFQSALEECEDVFGGGFRFGGRGGRDGGG